MEDLHNWNVRLISLEKIGKGDIIFIINEENKVTNGGLFIKWIDDNNFEFVNASSYYEKVVTESWKIDEKKSVIYRWRKA